MSLRFSNVMESWNVLPFSHCRMPHWMSGYVHFCLSGCLGMGTWPLPWFCYSEQCCWCLILRSSYILLSALELLEICRSVLWLKFRGCIMSSSPLWLHSDTRGLYFPTSAHIPAVSISSFNSLSSFWYEISSLYGFSLCFHSDLWHQTSFSWVIDIFRAVFISVRWIFFSWDSSFLLYCNREF